MTNLGRIHTLPKHIENHNFVNVILKNALALT
jgi:hypothetical protein